jgi:PST family polysaccharide transporter
MPDISIKKAVLINAVSKYAGILLNIVFTAVLSRILTPNDYGIVAIVTVFTTFFTMLGNLGMGTAVIQDKTLTGNEVNHIFSFSIYIAFVLVVVFCLFGLLIAWFYRDMVYIPISCILSASLFFNTLNMIPNAVLLGEKRFLLIGIRLLVVTISTYGITIVLALSGFKYYALVIQSVLSALLVFVLNLKNSRLKFIVKINFNSIRKIGAYSSYQFGFNFINYFARNLDNLVIGKVWGSVSLAQYDKAYRFMLFPVQNLTLVIGAALHPILSEHQNNKEYIYQKYQQIIKLLSLLGVFITAVCFWCSEEIIILVFGRQWYIAVGCFKWLSLSVWAQMVASSAGAIYQSIGNTKLMFVSGMVHVGISVFCILLGIRTGNLEQFSMIVACGFIVKFFVEYFFLITKGFSKSIGIFLTMFIPDMIIGIVLFFGLFFFSMFLLSSSLPLILVFVYKLLFSVAVYLLCLMVTGQWKVIKRGYLSNA